MQSYTEIPSSQSLQSSLALLLNNDKTVMSCSSGTAFPTANLQVGMLCWRTDLLKLYILKDATPTWALLLDLNTDQTTTLQTKGTVVGSGTDWNSMTVAGVYSVSAATMGTNGPAGGYTYGTLVVTAIGTVVAQLYLTHGASNVWYRSKLNASDWTAWTMQWNSVNDGAGSGLDADLLDGMQSGNASGNIPVSNGTVNTNLNADKVDGYDAGNASGNVPVSNGTVNTNLNADLLDGFHATSFVRTISGVAPDASGNVTVDMTAKADRNNGNLYAALAGTTTAYTVSLSGLTVAAGTRITVSNGVGANTASATLSVNGSAAAQIQVWSNGGLRSLVAGEFPAGVMSLVYNGSVWILQDVTTVVRSAGGGLSKSGDSIAMTGLHGGGYIDADGTANGNSAGFTGVQSQAGRMAVRLTFDSYGRVTNAWTYNCNCVCDCTC